MGILLWTTFWNLFELHQVFFFFLPSPNVLLLVYVTHEYIESGFHVSPSPRVCDTFSIFAYFHNLDSLGKYWLGVLKYALISEFSYSFFFVCDKTRVVGVWKGYDICQAPFLSHDMEVYDVHMTSLVMLTFITWLKYCLSVTLLHCTITIFPIISFIIGKWDSKSTPLMW